MMDWYLAAPFIHSPDDLWLARFVPNTAGDSRFFVVPASYHHDRSRKSTALLQWRDYFGHGAAVWNAARRSSTPAGILTCFPQLALATALRKRVASLDIPLVAWNFNLGVLHGGLRRRIARAALQGVDRFVVHSRAEIQAYGEWLDLPPTRFEFVPLQRAVRSIEIAEDETAPFVLSMGSAHRDYRLLFATLAELGLPAVVVAGRHAVEGLMVPANVSIRSGLSVEECHALVQRARVSVIPVDNERTASGQVTLLDAMMFGRPVIVTDCPASTDYVTDKHDALLVRRGDHDQMKLAVGTLWEDSAQRRAMGRAARATAIDRFSDEAIGKRMGDILADVAQRP
jgi:glycosyltransferase involved in cell wall biosynthesis